MRLYEMFYRINYSMIKQPVNFMLILSVLIFFTIAVDAWGLAREDVKLSEATKNFLLDANVDKLIFVKRYTYQSTHYYTDFIDGCERFGGNICVLSLGDGSVVEIVPSMKHGIFGRYDLSFDGKRIVFDWKEKVGKGFRIYEVGVDGTGLRQLTFDPPDEKSDP